jgi:outer membrane immunogenic protein
MRRFLLGGAVLALFAVGTAAIAADLPTHKAAPAPYLDPPIFTWTGFYLGLNVGGAWGNSSTSSPYANLLYVPSVATNINSQAGQRLNLSAATGGIEAGYNFQFGRLVLGAETDFGFLGLNGNRTVSAPFTGFAVPAGTTAPTYNNSVSTTWLYTARGRLGFTPMDRLLIFGTGGVAVTDLHYSHQYAEGTFPGSAGGVESASVSRTQVGAVVGGGVEWALTNSWLLKAEYLYANFGKVNTGPSPVLALGRTVTAGNFSHSADLAANMLRVGVDYKW